MEVGHSVSFLKLGNACQRLMYGLRKWWRVACDVSSIRNDFIECIGHGKLLTESPIWRPKQFGTNSLISSSMCFCYNNFEVDGILYISLLLICIKNARELGSASVQPLHKKSIESFSDPPLLPSPLPPTPARRTHFSKQIRRAQNCYWKVTWSPMQLIISVASVRLRDPLILLWIHESTGNG